MAQQDVIQAFVTIAPYLNKLLNDDVTIGVYDTSKLLINVPGKTFDLNVRTGQPLVEGDAITLAIRQNKEVSIIVPKEVFGFPLAAHAIPLHDETGRVIGGVGVGTSLEKAHKLFEMAESFSSIVEQTATTVGQINTSIDQLSGRVEDGTIYTSVAPHVINDATNLCIETGAIAEAHKYDKKVTHTLCLVRDDAHSPFIVLSPCGICQERLFYWGPKVQCAISTSGETIVFKTLQQLQPYHWTEAYAEDMKAHWEKEGLI